MGNIGRGGVNSSETGDTRRQVCEHVALNKLFGARRGAVNNVGLLSDTCVSLAEAMLECLS